MPTQRWLLSSLVQQSPQSSEGTMATRRFRGDPSLTSGTISCAKDTLSHLVKRGRRLRIWTGACSSSRVERCPTTVSPDTAGEADTRSPATVTRLVKTTVSTNSWPESKSLLWRGVLDVPGMPKGLARIRAFRNKLSPRDSAVIARNEQSDTLSDTARVRGNSKRQLVKTPG